MTSLPGGRRPREEACACGSGSSALGGSGCSTLACSPPSRSWTSCSSPISSHRARPRRPPLWAPRPRTWRRSSPPRTAWSSPPPRTHTGSSSARPCGGGSTYSKAHREISRPPSPRVRGRGFGRPLPAGLPAPVRRRIPRGAPDGGRGGAGDRVRLPARGSRPRPAARVVHPPERRPVPGLHGPRLRRHPLAPGARGGGGVRDGYRPGLPGVRQVRRHRHRGGDPAHGRRHARRADRGAPRPAGL